MSIDTIINELGDNFVTGDETVIQEIYERVTNVALLSANRTNTTNNVELLAPEIFECVKTIYLQRGAEDVNSRDAQGDNSEYKDPMKVLYKQIINHNKRLVL